MTIDPRPQCTGRQLGDARSPASRQLVGRPQPLHTRGCSRASTKHKCARDELQRLIRMGTADRRFHCSRACVNAALMAKIHNRSTGAGDPRTIRPPARDRMKANWWGSRKSACTAPSAASAANEGVRRNRREAGRSPRRPDLLTDREFVRSTAMHPLMRDDCRCARKPTVRLARRTVAGDQRVSATSTSRASPEQGLGLRRLLILRRSPIPGAITSKLPDFLRERVRPRRAVGRTSPRFDVLRDTANAAAADINASWRVGTRSRSELRRADQSLHPGLRRECARLTARPDGRGQRRNRHRPAGRGCSEMVPPGRLRFSDRH